MLEKVLYHWYAQIFQHLGMAVGLQTWGEGGPWVVKALLVVLALEQYLLWIAVAQEVEVVHLVHDQQQNFEDYQNAFEVLLEVEVEEGLCFFDFRYH